MACCAVVDPGLRREHVARHQAGPHLGVQVGAHQPLLRQRLASAPGATRSGSVEFTGKPSFFSAAPSTSAGSSSIVIRPSSRASHIAAHDAGGGRELAVVRDAGPAPHVGHRPVAAPGPRPETGTELRANPDAAATRAGAARAAPAPAWADEVVRREDHVPARVAGQHPRQHLLVALVDRVADAHAGLLLERPAIVSGAT